MHRTRKVDCTMALYKIFIFVILIIILLYFMYRMLYPLGITRDDDQEIQLF